jgi:predicted ATP-grasp superfamily ATP-dependent carboligase
MRTHFIVFSGYNERAVIAFLRAISRHEVDFSIIANGKNDRIFDTSYARRVACVRPTPSLLPEDILGVVRKVCNMNSGKNHILAPSTEALNRFFLAHRAECKALEVTVPLPDEELYCAISNKRSFADMCVSHGLDIPKELPCPLNAEIPFVAKPLSYAFWGALKPELILTEDDRRIFLKNGKTAQYFFQEYVHGKSIYLLMYIAKCGSVTAFAQENCIQQPDGKSIVAARVSDMSESSVQSAYISMLLSVGFHGLIMIEVRQNNHNSCMIEANPRFWGPSQLFVDAMPINLFDAFLRDYGVETNLPARTVSNLYYWHEGFLDVIRSGRTPVFHNYSWEEYIDEMPSWLNADIYRRQDTKPLFTKILSGAYL